MRRMWKLCLEIAGVVVVVLLIIFGKDWDWQKHLGLMAGGAFVLFLLAVWDIRSAIIEGRAFNFGMVALRDKNQVGYWFFLTIKCIVTAALGAISLLAFLAFLRQ